MFTRSRLWRACTLLALLGLSLAPFGSTARALSSTLPSEDLSTQDPPAGSPVVIRSLRNDVSPPLREMAPKAPPAGALNKLRELPVYPLPGRSQVESPLGGLDPAVQDKSVGINMPSFDFNFEGLSNEDNRNTIGFLVSPPDTAGAIGPDHYVQWDNHEGQLLDDSQWVGADEKTLSDSRVQCADLADGSYPWRHDSKKLAERLIAVLDEYTGPLE